MKLKVGDKVKLRRTRPIQPKNHWSIPKKSWKKGMEAVVSVYSEKCSYGKPGIRLKNLNGYVWPARYFDKVVEDIKAGDFVTIKKPYGIPYSQNGLSKRTWKKAEKSGVVKVESLTVMDTCAYVRINGTRWFFPVSSMTKADAPAKTKAKKVRNKFAIGDAVKITTHPKWTGKVIRRVSKTTRKDNYRVKWDVTSPATKGNISTWRGPKSMSKLSSVEIAATAVKKARKFKNKFAPGDAVRLKSNAGWIGSIIKRVDKRHRRIGNYLVRWNKTCPRKSVDTWNSPESLAKLTIGEMRILAKSNKRSDFKVGQRVTVVFSNSHKGKSGKITSRSSSYGSLTVDEGRCGIWAAPGSLYIHENTLVSVTNTAEEEKKRISLERKKERKVKAFFKKSSNKASKKVAKKASSKSKRSGYVVRALIANGAAEKAGIRVGDTIVKVDGRRVDARGSLGSVLRSFKKGAKVSLTIRKPDGREVYHRKVTLGGRKDGRATLGVISGKKNSSAYNLKVEGKAKMIAKKTKAATKVVLADVPENEFMKRARTEMEGVGALMADMKGRDALLKARDLRRKLHGELRAGLGDNTKLVNEYLEGLRKAGKSELVEGKSKRTLSRKGKVVFGLLGLATILGSAAWITSLLGYNLF